LSLLLELAPTCRCVFVCRCAVQTDSARGRLSQGCFRQPCLLLRACAGPVAWREDGLREPCTVPGMSGCRGDARGGELRTAVKAWGDSSGRRAPTGEKLEGKGMRENAETWCENLSCQRGWGLHRYSPPLRVCTPGPRSPRSRVQQPGKLGSSGASSEPWDAIRVDSPCGHRVWDPAASQSRGCRAALPGFGVGPGKAPGQLEQVGGGSAAALLQLREAWKHFSVPSKRDVLGLGQSQARCVVRRGLRTPVLGRGAGWRLWDEPTPRPGASELTSSDRAAPKGPGDAGWGRGEGLRVPAGCSSLVFFSFVGKQVCFAAFAILPLARFPNPSGKTHPSVRRGGPSPAAPAALRKWLRCGGFDLFLKGAQRCLLPPSHPPAELSPKAPGSAAAMQGGSRAPSPRSPAVPAR